MKTVKFTVRPGGYGCSEPGEQSGEYIKAETAKLLLEALKDALKEIEDLRDAISDWEGSRGSGSFSNTLKNIIQEHS